MALTAGLWRLRVGLRLPIAGAVLRVPGPEALESIGDRGQRVPHYRGRPAGLHARRHPGRTAAHQPWSAAITPPVGRRPALHRAEVGDQAPSVLPTRFCELGGMAKRRVRQRHDPRGRGVGVVPGTTDPRTLGSCSLREAVGDPEPATAAPAIVPAAAHGQPQASPARSASSRPWRGPSRRSCEARQCLPVRERHDPRGRGVRAAPATTDPRALGSCGRAAGGWLRARAPWQTAAPRSSDRT